MFHKFYVIAFLLIVFCFICELKAEIKEIKWAETTASSLIQKFPDPDSIHWVGQSNHFSWQAGYVMFAMEKMWRSTVTKNISIISKDM